MREIGDFLKNLTQTELIRIGGFTLTPGTLLTLLAIIAATAWAARLAERGLIRLAHGSGRFSVNASVAYSLSRVLRYLIWFIGLLIGLNFVGLDLTNLALLGGAVGVGIGFGLRNIFSNFVSGLMLLFERTLKVGDFVDLQSGVVGRVVEINVRYTRVTTTDAVDIIVPNSEFIEGRVTNWTLNERYRRIHVPFGIAYDSDKDAVREAGITAAKNVKGTIDQPGREPEVWLVGFGDSSLDFELVVWVDQDLVIVPARTQALYLWAIHTELTKRGIEIPFPQRDLHFKDAEIRLRRD